MGSNPLPVYLAARALRATELTLIHSVETRGQAERLTKALEGGATVKPPVCVDAYDGRDVVAKLRSLAGQGAHLDYTGGTKVMSAHARRLWGASPEAAARCSYVDGGRGELVTDDGVATSLALPEGRAGLDLLLGLHDAVLIKGAPKARATMPTRGA